MHVFYSALSAAASFTNHRRANYTSAHSGQNRATNDSNGDAEVYSCLHTPLSHTSPSQQFMSDVVESSLQGLPSRLHVKPVWQTPLPSQVVPAKHVLLHCPVSGLQAKQSGAEHVTPAQRSGGQFCGH
jgi:hypothetical protein